MKQNDLVKKTTIVSSLSRKWKKKNKKIHNTKVRTAGKKYIKGEQCLDIHYYYTGTDYSSLHPFHWDFWIAMLSDWNYLNWACLVLGLVYVIVKINDHLVKHNDIGK